MKSEPNWMPTLRHLCSLSAPVAQESDVTNYLQKRWAPLAQETTLTPIGNLIAHIGGRGKKLLVCAHADEICLMIRSVTDDGFLRVGLWIRDTLGHPPSWLQPVGHPAMVLARTGTLVEGTFATETGHARAHSSYADRKNQLSWDDLFVDIGARTAAEVAERGIHPGCRVVWDTALRSYGRVITSKALDDRVALAVMDQQLQAFEPDSAGWDVYFAVTVREEAGLAGAAEAARMTDPDAAIVVEVGLTGDTPNGDRHSLPVKLGDGPIVVYQDAATHYDWRLSQQLVALGSYHQIPIQESVFQSYSSDGAEFIRHGIPTALVTFPCRYTHSPFETADMSDIEDLSRLLNLILHTANEPS